VTNAMRQYPDVSDDNHDLWETFRPIVLVCALLAAGWALVGMWYGEFAGFALIGEPKEYEERVGHPQLYWASGALIAAIVAVLVVRRARVAPRVVAAVACLLASAGLSIVGFEARNAALHPNTAREISDFRPPSGARLVKERLGGGTSSRLWQSRRPFADVCREMKRAFRRWASNARDSTDEYEPCSISGNRGAFSTYLDVGYATRLQHIVGEPRLDPSRGEVGIRLVVLAD